MMKSTQRYYSSFLFLFCCFLYYVPNGWATTQIKSFLEIRNTLKNLNDTSVETQYETIKGDILSSFNKQGNKLVRDQLLLALGYLSVYKDQVAKNQKATEAYIKFRKEKRQEISIRRYNRIASQDENKFLFRPGILGKNDKENNLYVLFPLETLIALFLNLERKYDAFQRMLVKEYDLNFLDGLMYDIIQEKKRPVDQKIDAMVCLSKKSKLLAKPVYGFFMARMFQKEPTEEAKAFVKACLSNEKIFQEDQLKEYMIDPIGSFLTDSFYEEDNDQANASWYRWIAQKAWKELLLPFNEKEKKDSKHAEELLGLMEMKKYKGCWKVSFLLNNEQNGLSEKAKGWILEMMKRERLSDPEENALIGILLECKKEKYLDDKMLKDIWLHLTFHEISRTSKIRNRAQWFLSLKEGNFWLKGAISFTSLLAQKENDKFSIDWSRLVQLYSFFYSDHENLNKEQTNSLKLSFSLSFTKVEKKIIDEVIENLFKKDFNELFAYLEFKTLRWVAYIEFLVSLAQLSQEEQHSFDVLFTNSDKKVSQEKMKRILPVLLCVYFMYQNENRFSFPREKTEQVSKSLIQGLAKASIEVQKRVAYFLIGELMKVTKEDKKTYIGLQFFWYTSEKEPHYLYTWKCFKELHEACFDEGLLLDDNKASTTKRVDQVISLLKHKEVSPQFQKNWLTNIETFLTKKPNEKLEERKLWLVQALFAWISQWDKIRPLFEARWELPEYKTMFFWKQGTLFGSKERFDTLLTQEDKESEEITHFYNTAWLFYHFDRNKKAEAFKKFLKSFKNKGLLPELLYMLLIKAQSSHKAKYMLEYLVQKEVFEQVDLSMVCCEQKKFRTNSLHFFITLFLHTSQGIYTSSIAPIIQDEKKRSMRKQLFSALTKELDKLPIIEDGIHDEKPMMAASLGKALAQKPIIKAIEVWVDLNKEEKWNDYSESITALLKEAREGFVFLLCSQNYFFKRFLFKVFKDFWEDDNTPQEAKNKILDLLTKTQVGCLFIEKCLEYNVDISEEHIAKGWLQEIFSDNICAKRFRIIWHYDLRNLHNLLKEGLLSSDQKKQRDQDNIRLFLMLLFWSWNKKNNSHAEDLLTALIKRNDLVEDMFDLHSFLDEAKESSFASFERTEQGTSYLYDPADAARGISRLMIDQKNLMSDWLKKQVQYKFYRQNMLSFLFDYWDELPIVRKAIVYLIAPDDNDTSYSNALAPSCIKLPFYRYWLLNQKEKYQREFPKKWDTFKKKIEAKIIQETGKNPSSLVNTIDAKLTLKKVLQDRSIKEKKKNSFIINNWLKKEGIEGIDFNVLIEEISQFSFDISESQKKEFPRWRKSFNIVQDLKVLNYFISNYSNDLYGKVLFGILKEVASDGIGSRDRMVWHQDYNKIEFFIQICGIKEAKELQDSYFEVLSEAYYIPGGKLEVFTYLFNHAYRLSQEEQKAYLPALSSALTCLVEKCRYECFFEKDKLPKKYAVWLLVEVLSLREAKKKKQGTEMEDWKPFFAWAYPKAKEEMQKTEMEDWSPVFDWACPENMEKKSSKQIEVRSNSSVTLSDQQTTKPIRKGDTTDQTKPNDVIPKTKKNKSPVVDSFVQVAFNQFLYPLFGGLFILFFFYKMSMFLKESKVLVTTPGKKNKTKSNL